MGILGSLVSAGYYLRVVFILWMKEPSEEFESPAEDLLSGTAFVVSTVLILLFGIQPRALLDLASKGVAVLR